MTDPSPATFDIEAWLSGAVPVVKSCRVTLKAGLEGQIRDLDEQINVGILGVSGEGDVALRDLATERQALAVELEESWVVWRFRDLLQSDIDAIGEAMDGRDDSADERGLRVLAAQCVDPAGVTWETFQTMADSDAFPLSVFARIADTAAAARDAVAVSVPFSRNVSHILDGLTFSPS